MRPGTIDSLKVSALPERLVILLDRAMRAAGSGMILMMHSPRQGMAYRPVGSGAPGKDFITIGLATPQGRAIWLASEIRALGATFNEEDVVHVGG